MNDIAMDPAAVRRHCVELWSRKTDELEPEIERIAAILVGGGATGGRQRTVPAARRTLGGSGEVWSGADFGATHDEHASMAVRFLRDLADGWTACANGAAAAAESYREADHDSGLAIAVINGEPTGIRYDRGPRAER